MAVHGGTGNKATRTPQSDTVKGILNNTERRWRLPPGILAGIFGAESSYGKSGNWFGLVAVPRSSYGIQTLTGKHYDSGGKPTFSGDADLAGQTLRRLIDQHNGNVEAALQSYSGGGYVKVAKQNGFQSAAAYIAHLAKQIPGHVDVPESDLQKLAAGPVGDAVAGALSLPKELGRIADLLTSGEFWIRLGEAILGVLLLAMGLRSLTGAPAVPDVVRARVP